MLLSAVFIVPITYTLGGTLKSSPLCGRTTVTPRLSFSRSVISSPNILGIFPLLISSMRTKNRFWELASATRQTVLKLPSLRSSVRPSVSVGRGG